MGIFLTKLFFLVPIVLLDSVVDDSSSKSNYNNDLVSLALTESGIQEGSSSNVQDEDVDYGQLADEILGMYSAGQKKRYEYCFMKQKWQIQIVIAQYKNVVKPLSTKDIDTTH